MENNWLLLLQQILAIIANAGIPVLLANVAKQFFPKMDGKTDKIVNILVLVLFVAGVALQFYDPDLLAKLIPVIGEQAKQVTQLLTLVLSLIGSLGLTPLIYKAVQNRVPLLGKSFTPKA